MAVAVSHFAKLNLQKLIPRDLWSDASKLKDFGIRFSEPLDKKVARMTKKEFVCDIWGGKQSFAPRKAILGYDNSTDVLRYSGGGGENGLPGAQSAIYLGTQSKALIYPTITAELAYYTDKKKYAELQGEPAVSPYDSQRDYFDPHKVFPSTKVVIEYIPSPTLRVLNLTLAEIREGLSYVLRPHLIKTADALRMLIETVPDYEIQQWMDSATRNEVEKLSSGQPVSIDAAFRLPTYSLTAPLGNALLEANIGVVFTSARQDVVPVQEYMDNAANVALPMRPGLDLPIMPSRLFVFRAQDRKLQSILASDGQDLSSLSEEAAQPRITEET
jgi:hypothetical protein